MNTLIFISFAISAVASTGFSSGISVVGLGGLGHGVGLGHAVAINPWALSPVGPSGVVTGHDACGPSGIVTGAGAVGPSGIVNDHGAVRPTGPNGHGAAIIAAPALGLAAGLGHGALGVGLGHGALGLGVGHGLALGAHGW